MVCDQSTRDACYPRLQFDTMGPVMVKGNAEAVAVFRPEMMMLKRSADDVAVVEFVGRKKILHKIKTNLHELVRGRHSWVTVITKAKGMGKSAIGAFAMQLAHQLEIVALMGGVRSDPDLNFVLCVAECGPQIGGLACGGKGGDGTREVGGVVNEVGV